jgi:nucleoside triphosphatase
MTKRQDPSIVVAAFIFNDKDELFLTKSERWGNKYVIPGGHLEYGEYLKDALKREIKEETNLDIENIDFLGFNELLNLEEDFYKDRHMVSLHFKCRTSGNKIILEEAEEYLWIKVKDALELDLHEGIRKDIEKYFI